MYLIVNHAQTNTCTHKNAPLKLQARLLWLRRDFVSRHSSAADRAARGADNRRAQHVSAAGSNRHWDFHPGMRPRHQLQVSGRGHFLLCGVLVLSHCQGLSLACFIARIWAAKATIKYFTNCPKPYLIMFSYCRLLELQENIAHSN
jgi:hypothetical protein